MNTPPKTIALLIDGDNAPLKFTEQIIQFCEDRGILSIKNAYGDWKKRQLSSRGQTITALGVNLVQQDRGKNSADFALAMDVAVMLYKSEADSYFIVSNDADFATVCQRIRQKGAQVFGIGIKSKTSSKMRNACTKFFDVEKDIVKKPSKATTKSATASKPKPKPTDATEKKPSKVSTKSAAPKPKTPTTEATGKKQSKASKKSVPTAKAEIKPTDATEKKPSKTSKKSADPKSKFPTILEILTLAYHETSQKDGWAFLAQFDPAFRRIDEQNGKRFATKKPLTWLKGFQDKFVVEKDRVRLK